MRGSTLKKILSEQGMSISEIEISCGGVVHGRVNRIGKALPTLGER